MRENYQDDVRANFYRLSGLLSTESSEAKDIRAEFRHAIGTQPGEIPVIWGWVVEHIDENLQGKSGDISFAEYALFITLALYVMWPNEDRTYTFAAASALADVSRRRFVGAETAKDMEEMQVALRGIVKLIMSKKKGFNYGQLAQDLYSWQFDKVSIARKWEREYVKANYQQKGDEK